MPSATPPPLPPADRFRRVKVVGALIGVLGLVGVGLIPPPAVANLTDSASLDADVQQLDVEADAAAVSEKSTVEAEPDPDEPIDPADLASVDGVQELIAGGTNEDWARLILLLGDWPVTDDSITAIKQWMRQENYENSWWTRNNPLNNGWGLGSFMGTNSDLVVAAWNVVDAINTLPGYAGIKKAFEDAAPADDIAYAIWYSTWAGGHYDYGGHWSTAPTQTIEAPASAWGD